VSVFFLNSACGDFKAKPEQNGDHKLPPPGFNSCKVGKRRGKNNVAREENLKSHNKEKESRSQKPLLSLFSSQR